MPTKFEDFVREVEDEARAAGPRSVAELETFRAHFTMAQDVRDLDAAASCTGTGTISRTMEKAHLIRPKRSLPTTQARTELPRLVNELVAVDEPGKTLADHAIELGPRNRGGVWLVPAVDVDAAMDREESLRARVDELEDEAENMALGLFLTERLQQSSGSTTSGADFIRELGFEDLAADLPT